MTPESLIYENLEDALKTSKWAPLVLKIIAKETEKDGWCHYSFKDWFEKKDINVWTLTTILKWAVKRKLIQKKLVPPEGKLKSKRGRKRVAYKLVLS